MKQTTVIDQAIDDVGQNGAAPVAAVAAPPAGAPAEEYLPAPLREQWAWYQQQVEAAVAEEQRGRQLLAQADQRRAGFNLFVAYLNEHGYEGVQLDRDGRVTRGE